MAKQRKKLAVKVLKSSPDPPSSPDASPSSDTDDSSWKPWAVGQVVRIPVHSSLSSLSIRAPPATIQTSRTALAIVAVRYEYRMVVLPITNGQMPDEKTCLDVVARDPSIHNYPINSLAATQATSQPDNFLGIIPLNPGSMKLKANNFADMTDVVSVEYGDHIERVGELIPESLSLLNRRYAFAHGPIAAIPPDEQDKTWSAHILGQQTGYEPNSSTGQQFFTTQPLFSPPRRRAKRKTVTKVAAHTPAPATAGEDENAKPDGGAAGVSTATIIGKKKLAAKKETKGAQTSSTISTASQKLSYQRNNNKWDCGHTGICQPGGKGCKHKCCKNGAKSAPKGWRRIDKDGNELPPLSDAHVKQKVEEIVDEDGEAETDHEHDKKSDKGKNAGVEENDENDGEDGNEAGGEGAATDEDNDEGDDDEDEHKEDNVGDENTSNQPSDEDEDDSSDKGNEDKDDGDDSSSDEEDDDPKDKGNSKVKSTSAAAKTPTKKMPLCTNTSLTVQDAPSTNSNSSKENKRVSTYSSLSEIDTPTKKGRPFKKRSPLPALSPLSSLNVPVRSPRRSNRISPGNDDDDDFTIYDQEGSSADELSSSQTRAQLADQAARGTAIMRAAATAAKFGSQQKKRKDEERKRKEAEQKAKKDGKNDDTTDVASSSPSKSDASKGKKERKRKADVLDEDGEADDGGTDVQKDDEDNQTPGPVPRSQRVAGRSYAKRGSPMKLQKR